MKLMVQNKPGFVEKIEFEKLVVFLIIEVIE